jgi:hypothetical protein
MKTILVLAMHGVPPNNFPECEMAELFSLHSRVKGVAGQERATLERRLIELDAKCARGRAQQRTIRSMLRLKSWEHT